MTPSLHPVLEARPSMPAQVVTTGETRSTGAPASHAFPMRSFATGIALTVGMFLLGSLIAWRLYVGFRDVATVDLHLTTLGGEIVHLDEVLTMSARMSAATGDPSWEVLQLLGHAALAERAELRFDCDVEHAELCGRPGRLEQVVTNLVRNAIEATAERGGGEVRVTLRRGSDHLDLQVADDGPGIEPGVVERIFDPLFTTKAIGKGTGLGLTIVHDIVHGELGGRVEVATELGSGATFTVRIPCRDGVPA